MLLGRAFLEYRGYSMGSPYRDRRTLEVSVHGGAVSASAALYAAWRRLVEAAAMVDLAGVCSGRHPAGCDGEPVLGRDPGDVLSGYPYGLGTGSNHGGRMEVVAADSYVLVSAEHNASVWGTDILLSDWGLPIAYVERPSGAWSVFVPGRWLLEAWARVFRDLFRAVARAAAAQGDPESSHCVLGEEAWVCVTFTGGETA